jgi:hypothetical protein
LQYGVRQSSAVRTLERHRETPRAGKAFECAPRERVDRLLALRDLARHRRKVGGDRFAGHRADRQHVVGQKHVMSHAICGAAEDSVVMGILPR